LNRLGGRVDGQPALTDALEQELDRQQVGAPHVMGVSLGGRLGLELARRKRRDRWSRLPRPDH